MQHGLISPGPGMDELSWRDEFATSCQLDIR